MAHTDRRPGPGPRVRTRGIVALATLVVLYLVVGLWRFAPHLGAGLFPGW